MIGFRPCLLALLLAAAGCRREEPPFLVRQCDPAPGSVLALNQEVCLLFSHYIEPASVTPETVRVADALGRPVPGQLLVRGKAVLFRPRPPLLQDLTDGGFKPGQAYHVEVPGFPLLHTVRQRGGGGQTLAGTFRAQLRATALAGATVPALVDGESPRIGATPHLVEPFLPGLWLLRLQPGESLRLTFSERLDPRLVGPPGPFLLATLEGRRIPIHDVRLAAKGVEPDFLGRVVEVVPAEPLEAEREYPLEILSGPWLHDYSGNPLFLGTGEGEPLRVLVRVDRRHGEEFFSNPADCDEETGRDEAWGWWGGGELTACLLEEAGGGDLGAFHPEGDVRLAPGVEIDLGGGRRLVCPGRDLAFSRIEIPAGVTVTLASGGPWVLRSQGPLQVSGRLMVAGGRPVPPPAGGTLQAPGRLLHDRLELLREGGLLLASSGNLTLEGELRLEGGGATLLSGGQVRLGRLAQVEGGWLELADRRQLPPAVGLRSHALRTTLGLFGAGRGWVNEPLPVSALSRFRELPAGEGPLQLPVVHAIPVGQGSVAISVQGAPADPADPGRPDLSRLTPEYCATNVGALEGCRFFRFRVRFVVPPGPKIAVPRVTAVLLRRS